MRFTNLKLIVCVPVILSVVLSVATSCTDGGGGRSVSVPKPAAPESQETLAYVLLPSLERAIANAGALSQRVSGQFGPEQLRGMVGGMLGDPQLADLDTERPIALVVFRAGSQQGPMPPTALFVPVKKGETYAQRLQQFGMQTKVADGLLLAAQTPGALSTAENARATYDGLAGATVTSDLRLYFHLGRLLEVYGPMIRGGMDGILQMFSQTAASAMPGQGQESAGALASFLALEAKGLLALVEQSEEVQVDLDLGDHGFRMEKVVTAKPDSDLAAFFDKSATGDASALGYLEVERGSMAAAAFDIDAEATGVLFGNILERLSEDPALQGLVSSDLVQMAKDFGVCWSGEGVMTMTTSQDRFFDIQSVGKVADGEKYLEVTERMLASVFQEGGVVHQLYKGLGMDLTMKLVRDVREHEGVPVHRLDVEFQLGNPGFQPGEAERKAQEELMAKMVPDSEFAIVEGYVLSAHSPEALDGLIEKANAGELGGSSLSLHGIEAFGRGYAAYIDYDLVKVMKAAGSTFLAQMDPDMPNPFKTLPSVPPLSFAVGFEKSRAVVRFVIPAAVMEAFGQMGGAAAQPPAPPESQEGE